MPRSRTPRSRPLVAVLALGLPVLLVACGDGDVPAAVGPGGASTATKPRVSIERSRYAPADVAIDVGDTVEFVNIDAFDHTVTAADRSPRSFDSGALAPDAVFQVSFEERGTYRYFCAIHPTMRATVTVG